ncbi:Cytochrome c oxidase subunit 2 precursor [Variovorax sp. PBS-H4]|uniref:cytochrome c oxidase subunit II n=1 Tax=Variovorax sp. PBS-H4 TaxID=434008 RepID=UPI001316CF07|nr:cytochrome c oxidase subunit II [Variovorax sp. PBS-H4]VTU33556.1 Cytochrome c oxidase subunit 2 precursor [Variovorax sp. PBS-H4]
MNGDTDARLSSNFRLLAESASTVAQDTDLLFAAMLVLCGVVALGVCIAVVFFAVRYRQGARVTRGNVARNLGLELGWTLVPLALFIALFAWAAHGFVRLYRVPPDALPVYVVAKQWMWKLQHRNGRREINELHVPLGQPVHLLMTSQDAIHSFYVPAFRLKQDLVPGRYTGLWFTATQLGEFRLFCAEYCGTEHSQMLGRIVVMNPGEYARWLGSGNEQPSLAQYGFARFRQLGCSGCHSANSTVAAPSLEGLLGRTVHLQDGRSLVADENYVRDSILLPKKDVVAGFAPVMPSFAGQVSEEDIQALVAYLRSTAVPAGAQR